MKTMKFLSFCMVVGATAVQAQTESEGLYPVNTTVRDYAKRDRLLIGGLHYVSPSQLHENAGLRARVGAELQNSELKTQGTRSDLSTPIGNLAVAYGWQDWTLGVRGSYLSAKIEGRDGNPITEDFKSTKIMPEVAYTFGQYFTAGAGIEYADLEVDEQLTVNNDFRYAYSRAVAGLAYHMPSYEVGISYTSEVQTSDALSTDREGTLALASSGAPNERAIYLPAMGTVYARGNVTDNFSLMSSISLARYDGNVKGAIPLFEEYDNQDRLAAKLVGTFWTDARSHISLAAEYKGAATTAIGEEEAGLGYRLANLYGGTLEGVLAIDRLTYLGVNGSYMRGERSATEAVSQQRFTSKEDTTRFAGFVTVKM